LPEEGILYSDFDDLRQLLDHLRIDRAHIAGWSMGSGIAVDFVLAYSEHALSLVAVGPWVNGHTSPKATAMFTDVGGVVAKLSDHGAEAGADAWMKAPFFAATIRDPSAGAEFHGIAQEYSWWALLNSSPLQALEPSAVERLESIQVPTLVLTADYDIPACLEVADLLEQRVPGTHKIVMAETGHLLHMEQPGEFNAHLVGFLEGAPE
jgi:pimeloyl-ACP methyl ester carboxylesterase